MTDAEDVLVEARGARLGVPVVARGDRLDLPAVRGDWLGTAVAVAARGDWLGTAVAVAARGEMLDVPVEARGDWLGVGGRDGRGQVTAVSSGGTDSPLTP
jgi:hypothetical protein